MPAITGIAVLGKIKAAFGMVPLVAAVEGNSFGALARAQA